MHLYLYNPDGSPDTSFDGDGRVTTDFGQDDQAVAVALQPDGRIVVAGTSTATLPPFTDKDFAVARYDVNGSLDSSFDGDGNGTVGDDFVLVGDPATNKLFRLFGDADGSGAMDISDAVFLIQYIFQGGPAPEAFCTGDLTGDGVIDIIDAVAIIIHIFVG